MTVLTEGNYAGAHIVSEAERERSRDTGLIAQGADLSPGTILGMIESSGKYAMLDPSASDGSEVAVAVLFAGVKASAADAMGVVHVRSCQINSGEITWPDGITVAQIATATTQLKDAGIILRDGAQ